MRHRRGLSQTGFSRFSCSCVTEEERAWGGWQDTCDPGCGVWRRVVVTLCRPCIGSAPPSAHGGWGCGCELGALDTCPLTDGPQSGGVSFPVPPRPSLGLAKAACHTAMPSWPPRGPGWPPAPVRDLDLQRLGGPGLRSWWQRWDEDAALAFPPAHLDFLLVSSCCCSFSFWPRRVACGISIP